MIGDGWCQKYGMIIIVFYGWSIKGVVEPCCQAKLKGKKIVFQNKNTFNGYRQHIDMHCPASHSQNSIGFVLPSCCRSVGSGGPRGRGDLSPLVLWRIFFFVSHFTFQLILKIFHNSLNIRLCPHQVFRPSDAPAVFLAKGPGLGMTGAVIVHSAGHHSTI